MWCVACVRSVGEARKLERSTSTRCVIQASWPRLQERSSILKVGSLRLHDDSAKSTWACRMSFIGLRTSCFGVRSLPNSQLVGLVAAVVGEYSAGYVDSSHDAEGDHDHHGGITDPLPSTDAALGARASSCQSGDRSAEGLHE